MKKSNKKQLEKSHRRYRAKVKTEMTNILKIEGL